MVSEIKKADGPCERDKREGWIGGINCSTRTKDSLRPAMPFTRTSIVRALDTMAGKNSIHLLCEDSDNRARHAYDVVGANRNNAR